MALHDLAATFLDFADAAPLPDSDARSLGDVLRDPGETHRDFVCSGLGDWNMIFDGRYKLIEGADPSPLLYDLREDPKELKNVAEDHPEIVKKLGEILQAQSNRPD